MLDEKMADFSKLVQACRSYRRFDEAAGMPREVLIDLVDTARQTASGANRMPLRYRVVCAEQERAAVFVHLRWAGALKRLGRTGAGRASCRLHCDLRRGRRCHHGGG